MHIYIYVCICTYPVGSIYFCFYIHDFRHAYLELDNPLWDSSSGLTNSSCLSVPELSIVAYSAGIGLCGISPIHVSMSIGAVTMLPYLGSIIIVLSGV